MCTGKKQLYKTAKKKKKIPKSQFTKIPTQITLKPPVHRHDQPLAH